MNNKRTEIFVNPYNFIPLGNGVDRKEKKSLSEGSLTGYISCKLTVKTPLLLPDHSAETEKNKFEFYSVLNEPTIPGSELRGCIRSVFETVTNSCLSVLDDKEKVKGVVVPVFDMVNHTNREKPYTPCKNNDLCPACSLFGALGKASAIRFSDARGINVELDDDFRILPEFSSPKFSTMSFYTFNSNTEYNEENEYYPRWKYKDANTYIRGRKYYFHKNVDDRQIKMGPRQIATKSAKKGEFIFKVYFEKITEKELKQLLWVLTLGENLSDSKLMHKLGMGRPIGYGSVKITVEESGIFLRKIENGSYITENKSFEDYAIASYDTSLSMDEDAVRKLLTICNFDYLKDYEVSYPLSYDSHGNVEPSFKWFNNNDVTENKMKVGYRQILPTISDDLTEKPILKTTMKK